MKPSNIMIESVRGNPDHVKVLDFGISRTHTTDSWQSHLDRQIIGSQYYMAPEQVLGERVSAQTDVYGLGVVLFTALTASYPFDEPDDVRLMEAIVNQPAPRPSEAPRSGLPVPDDSGRPPSRHQAAAGAHPRPETDPPAWRGYRAAVSSR